MGIAEAWRRSGLKVVVVIVAGLAAGDDMSWQRRRRKMETDGDEHAEDEWDVDPVVEL